MFRTDLAMESAQGTAVPGVTIDKQHREMLEQTRVHVSDEQGAQRLGKPVGVYITEQWSDFVLKDSRQRDRAAELMAQTLGELLAQTQGKPGARTPGQREQDEQRPWTLGKQRPQAADPQTAGEVLSRVLENRQGEGNHVLVVGLGNRHITADALGPRVVEKLLVTRHIHMAYPGELDGRFCTVSAIAPGVMGETGVETAEVVRALVGSLQPDVVICVDSLASRRTVRIACTLQMTDAGLQPGAGLGNRRAVLNQEHLGVPVIAIGVPMVVYAATICQDAAEAMAQSIQKNRVGNAQSHAENPHARDGNPQTDDENAQAGKISALGCEGKVQGRETSALGCKKTPQAAHLPSREWLEELPREVAETAQSAFGDLVVTPKEIDSIIEDAATLVADCINLTLHRGVTLDQLHSMVM